MSEQPLSPVVVDTDVGYDDVLAVAMLLAAGAPIRGLTVVNGLAHADRGAANLLRLLDRLGRGDLPVAVGAAAPLTGGRAFESAWRAEADALPGLTLPPTDRVPATESAADFLIAAARRHAGTLTVLALGPLTNLALAIRQTEDFAARVGRLIVMGGAVRVPGNGTPNGTAEWNIYVDPVAAALVLGSGIPTVLIGLDVTNEAPWTAALAASLCERPAPTAAGRLIQEVMRRQGTYLYDAVAAAYLLDPAVLTTRRLPIRVVTRGPDAGRTVEDAAGGGPIDVGLGLDYPRFRRLLFRLVGAGEPAPPYPDR